MRRLGMLRTFLRQVLGLAPLLAAISVVPANGTTSFTVRPPAQYLGVVVGDYSANLDCPTAAVTCAHEAWLQRSTWFGYRDIPETRVWNQTSGGVTACVKGTYEYKTSLRADYSYAAPLTITVNGGEVGVSYRGYGVQTTSVHRTSAARRYTCSENYNYTP